MKRPLFVLWCLLSLVFAAPSTALAMGERAQIFENVVDGGIWDHGDEFYLVIDLQELAGQKDVKGVWAGFHAGVASATAGAADFTGEVVIDQFGKNELRFNATATVLRATKEARFVLVTVFDAKGATIKEFIVKSAVRG